MAVQAAGVAALESYDEFVPGNVATFKQRRDAAVAAFRAAGFACETPRATMYLWIALPGEIPSALFAERLLEEEGVVVMAGSSFGAGGEGFFRISFVTQPGANRRSGEARRPRARLDGCGGRMKRSQFERPARRQRLDRRVGGGPRRS